MTGVAQHTIRSAAPLLVSTTPDRLSPQVLLVFLLCWVAAVLVILRLIGPHRPRPPMDSSRGPFLGPDRPEPTPNSGGPAPDVAEREGSKWYVADQLHRVPVQIVVPSDAVDRVGCLDDRAAADMLEDLAGPVLDAGRRPYRRDWGGILLHDSDEREIVEVVAALAASHAVPLLVVQAHDIVPADRRSVVAPVFGLAAAKAPCVLVIEGVDDLADPAAPLVISQHARRVEHELTTAIRVEDRQASVVVIASARSRDAVAPTLLQNGCLDRVIAVGTPTARQRDLIVRSELLRRHARVDGALNDVVGLTEGMNHHRIVAAVHDACRAARQRDPTSQPLMVSMLDIHAAVRQPSDAGPLAIGRDRETRIRELVQLAQDPAASFGLVLAGDEGNGGADVARWVTARVRRAVAWLDAGELGSVTVEDLERTLVAAFAQLPVLVVWERLDVLLGAGTDGSRRRKSVLAGVEHLARTSGAAIIATMQQPELIEPRLIEDGTLEVLWIPAPAFHDRVALLRHALGHAVLVDTTTEEVAAALHGASRAQVLARCQGAIHAAVLRQRADRSQPLEVLRADFRWPRGRSDREA